MSETNQSDQRGSAVEDGFHVQDAASANWVVRKVVEARQYAERVQAWAEAELRRTKREEEFFLLRFGSQLEQWVRSELASNGGRRRSICLPAGRVGFRIRPPRLDIVDEPALLGWCRNNLPRAVVIRESVSRSIVLEHIAKTGELLAGSASTEGSEIFYVR